MTSNLLVLSFQEKLEETIERTHHLVALIPPDRIHWKPPLADLLTHLLQCLGGFCSVFLKAFPNKLPHLAGLQSLEHQSIAEPKDALAAIQTYANQIQEAFGLCNDADLTRSLPTHFTPQGETILKLLLNNLEHLINHKYQLFVYLKSMGLPVTSADLYRFR